MYKDVIGAAYSALVKEKPEDKQALKQLIADGDVVILCPDEKEATEYGDKGITIKELLNGEITKPLYFTNTALINILTTSYNHITALQDALDAHQGFVNDIDRAKEILAKLANVKKQ